MNGGQEVERLRQGGEEVRSSDMFGYQEVERLRKEVRRSGAQTCIEVMKWNV
jgi:hypothetical protein